MKGFFFRAPLIFGLWTLYGILQTLQTHYRLQIAGRPLAWGSAAYTELSYAYLWALLTPAILWLGDRFRITSRGWWRNAMLHMMAALVFAAISKGAWDYLALPMLAPDKMPKSLFEEALSVLSALDYGFLHYALVLMCHHAVEYYQRYEEGKLRASQLEAQLANAQLQALKMQLHPHFLFNTLHAIAELVHEDADAAESMITRLSDFLRLTLDHVGIPEVALSEELDFLKRYLEIERMRFEDRLEVTFDVDADTLAARVPNLILQPIVENALKHGLSKRSGQGLLRIACRRSDEQLSMKVFDNGPGMQNGSGSVREGVGLNNTRNRLQHMYGGKHKITFATIPAGGFEVTIQIPYFTTGLKAN